MNRTAGVVVAVVLVIVAGASGFWLWNGREPPPIPAPPSAPRVEAPAPVQAAAPAGPENPVSANPSPERPLPPLKASDDAVRADLTAALPPSAMERLMLEGFIHRVVATVDNLPREQFAQRLSPVVAVPGWPKVAGRDDTLAWSSENDARYAPYVAAMEAVDTNRLVDFYLRYYPLFQEAYVELGYPNGYFNDRLVAVIDHLLGAPAVSGPIPLTQPKVLYEFANPELQRLSSGRKVLVRLGAGSEEKVKAKLRAIRARIAKAR